MFALAQTAALEVETHPANKIEYLFLANGWRGHHQIESLLAGCYTTA